MPRPTTFTPELGERVCELIAEGNSVAKVGGMKGMPSKKTIFRWLATADAQAKEAAEAGPDDNVKRPFAAFRQMYHRAREFRAEARFEKADEIMEAVKKGTLKADQARVMLDAIKWQTAIENAKRYGQAVTLRGDKDAPVEVKQTTVQELTEAQLQAIAAQALQQGQGTGNGTG